MVTEVMSLMPVLITIGSTQQRETPVFRLHLVTVDRRVQTSNLSLRLAVSQYIILNHNKIRILL